MFWLAAAAAIALAASAEGKIKHKQGLRGPPAVSPPVPVEENWFVQSLDHFRPTDGRTWKQRYWIRLDYYKPGGPVLLMIGGEGEANVAWMGAGSWTVYAEREGAAMVMLEHRYYGHSRPTQDISVKNLTWLTSRQALADIAAFIQAMNKQQNFTGKWIALGGSYPGSLAAWMRLKYPHLVAGAVSTSGPLRAKIDFYEYLEVVAEALETAASGCTAALQEALRKVQFLTTHRVGWTLLTAKFSLCTNFDGTSRPDVNQLFESLIDIFQGVVQYNKDNREFEGAEWTNITMDSLCSIMTDPTKGTELERLQQIASLSLVMAGDKCLDHTYKSQLSELQGTAWNSSAAKGGRQWTYQTCTEFGWYQSSDTPSKAWGNIIPVRFFETMCTDIFGPRFNEALLKRAVQDTNTYYGSTDIKASNIVFVHGSVDPWHAMGITNTSESGLEAIYIEGTAHCANMYPEKKDDPPQLKQARKRVGELIAQWVR